MDSAGEVSSQHVPRRPTRRNRAKRGQDNAAGIHAGRNGSPIREGDATADFETPDTRGGERIVPAPITADQKQRIIDLHTQGLSRNAIVRETGLSAGTVTKVCTENGLSFDRSATINATQAKVADNKARRQSIIGRLYGRAERILDRLESEKYVYTVTTKDSVEKVEDVAPPAGDERNLATSIAVYLDKATKLEDYDRTGDESGAAVDKWLAFMMGGTGGG